MLCKNALELICRYCHAKYWAFWLLVFMFDEHEGEPWNLQLNSAFCAITTWLKIVVSAWQKSVSLQCWISLTPSSRAWWKHTSPLQHSVEWICVSNLRVEKSETIRNKDCPKHAPKHQYPTLWPEMSYGTVLKRPLVLGFSASDHHAKRPQTARFVTNTVKADWYWYCRVRCWKSSLISQKPGMIQSSRRCR